MVSFQESCKMFDSNLVLITVLTLNLPFYYGHRRHCHHSIMTQAASCTVDC
jgi:hypothetical protein